MANIVYNFSGKTALVTGGSRGIGQSIVRELTNAGARVIFTYAKNKKAADLVSEECGGFSGEAIPFRCDFRSQRDIGELIQFLAVEFHDSLDFVVNNAGVIHDSPIYNMSQNQWTDTLEINLNSSFNLFRPLIRPLTVSRGCIVNIASVSGIVGSAGQANYSASKAGMIGFTKALSKEIGRLGVRANCIAPGYVETGMMDRISLSKRKQIKNNISLKRLGIPEEIANAVLFLLSEEASYITGEVLVVDGGLI